MALENILGKGENAAMQHFSPFPKMFSNFSTLNSKVLATFSLSPEITSNFRKLEIFS